MDKSIMTLEEGTTCAAWNYSGHRMAAGLDDGTLAVYDATDPSSSTFSCTSKFKLLQMEWDMSGMTLASTGGDGVVRLWQSDLNGVWRQQAILSPST